MSRRVVAGGVLAGTILLVACTSRVGYQRPRSDGHGDGGTTFGDAGDARPPGDAGDARPPVDGLAEADSLPPGDGTGALVVEALYPQHGKNWNDYVKADGTDSFSALDTACAGSELGYDACIHGGEKRVVRTTATSCAGLSATDALGAFDWSCVLRGGHAELVTTGLAATMGLRDLVDIAGWKANAVTLTGALSATSEPAVWYENPVSPLPPNPLPSDVGVILSGAGTIYVAASSATTAGYELGADRQALVTLGSAVLSSALPTSPNCLSDRCLVYASNRSFVWVETSLDGVGANVNGADWDIDIDYGAFAVMRGCDLTGARLIAGIFDTATSGQMVYSHCHDGPGCFGLWAGSHHLAAHLVSERTSTGFGAEAFNLRGVTDSVLVDLTANDNTDAAIRVWDGAARNRISQLRANNSEAAGVRVEAGAVDNSFDDVVIIQHNPGQGVVDGIAIAAGASRTTVTNARVASLDFGTPGNGIGVAADDCRLAHLTLLANGLAGLHVTGNRVQVQDVLAANNAGSGVDIASGSADGTYVDLRTFANASAGVRNLGARNTLTHVTSMNNGAEGVLAAAAGNTYAQVVAANNGAAGLSLATATAADSVANLVSWGNQGAGVSVVTAPGAVFSRNLLVAANSGGGCAAGPGCGLVNTTCSASGVDGDTSYGTEASTARFQTSTVLLATSFVGALAVDDAQNISDNLGTQTEASITDWLSFANRWRGWGKNGAAFPSASDRDACLSGTCRIWDVRLSAVDTAIRGRSGNGVSANAAFAVGSLCPVAAGGAVVVTDSQTSPHTFLVNAVELAGDGVGNDNGLCESGEACVYSSSFGAYQGEGDPVLGGACTFQPGSVSGVTLYAYPVDGG